MAEGVDKDKRNIGGTRDEVEETFTEKVIFLVSSDDFWFCIQSGLVGWY